MKQITLLIILLFVLGCAPNHTYKYYGFIDSDSDLGVGILSVGLRGTFVIVDSSKPMKVTHKGKPYEFWVWFKAQEDNIERIKISDIVIKSKDGDIIHELAGGEINPTWSDYQKAFTGGWYQKGLNVPHSPLIIELKATLNLGNETLIKEIKTELNTTYKEEKKNDFWSMLMSV